MTLTSKSATELARMIRVGDTSSRQVVEAHLQQIDAVNERVNAVTVVLRDSALAAADRADSGPAMGPLHGVPFTVKENLDCLGSATTHGVPALSHAMPYEDAPMVARMKAAGGIPIGRTNLSEMGLRVCTDSPLRGRTRNPWNAALTVGGSSGGDAVAVALGMTPIGLGNDLGGSLRLPAGCAGVATLKATVGRIAHASSLPPLDHGMAGQAMLSPGPIARTVADLRLCLQILAGRDPRDPRSVDVPLEGKQPYALTAALVTQLPGSDLPESAVQAIVNAGELLKSAGWQVEEAQPPELTRVSEIWGALVATDFSVLTPMMQPILSPELFDHMTRLCASIDENRPSNHRLHTERARLIRAWSAFFTRYSVVIGPNWSTLPWPIDSDLHPETGIDLLWETVRFITPGNALGLPAVALPMGLADGLPTSIQIYADLWREDLCLRAAETIEAGVTAISRR